MKKLIATFALLILLSTTFASKALAQVQTVKFAIVTPTSDQTLYGNRIPIIFSVENFTLVDTKATTATAGEGHILVWLDDTSKSQDTATKVASDTFTFSDVSYGDHTLYAQLVTSDNKPLNPPQEQTVTFKTAGLPTSTPPTATTFDKKTSLVILIIVALVIIAAWWYTRDEESEGSEESKSSKPKTAKKTVKKVKKVSKRK